jgi:hypothetical protein
MTFIKAAVAAMFAVASTFIFASGSEAAPLPTNVGAMKAMLDNDVVQVRYVGYRGGWGGGYRGGLGYRGLGYGVWVIAAWDMDIEAMVIVDGERALSLRALSSVARFASSSYYGDIPMVEDTATVAATAEDTATIIVRPTPIAAMEAMAATTQGGATIPAGELGLGID